MVFAKIDKTCLGRALSVKVRSYMYTKMICTVEYSQILNSAGDSKDQGGHSKNRLGVLSFLLFSNKDNYLQGSFSLI